MSEQETYQVRFDWGVRGANALAADIVVWVDVLGDEPVPLDDVPAPTVVRADFRTAAQTAQWILERQQELSARQQIAVIAAGVPQADGWRYTVEDHLAAGAIIDALGALGIDATSPEAATAEAAYRGLARAAGHMVTASVSGRQTPPAPGLAKADPSLPVEVLRG